MESVSAFLSMGGYGAYVWPAYAVAFVVMAGLLAVTLRGLKRREATLKLLEGNRPRRRARAGAEETDDA